MAGPGITSANTHPIVPDGEFWNHPRHIELVRYGGVYTNAFDPFYQSVISADTKFWYRGAGGPQIKSFAQLNSGIPLNTNFSDGTIAIPGVGCTTHSLHTKRIYDVSFNFDEVDSINFLNPSQDDAVFLWTEYPMTGYTSSRFYYINGVLTKIGVDYDWTQFTTESNALGKAGYILTSKPFSSSAKIGMTYTTGAANTGLWQTGSNNTQGFVDGLNRTFNFWLTASYVADGIIDITSSFGNQITEYGATEQLYNIFIGSIQTGSTPRFHHGATPPGSFTQQTYYSSSLFSGVQGWDVTSSNAEITFYHDSDTQNKIMWKGSILDPDTGFITFGDLEITGSGVTVNSVDMVNERYHRTIEMISTPTHVYHTHSADKAEEAVKFKDPQPHKVKKPTCECIDILRWFNIPYQMPDALCRPGYPLYYYRLTFNDGYKFTCGGLLRLITFNPLFASATQSMGVNYPNSGQWPHSLQLRTAVELYDNSGSFVNRNDVGFVKCADLVPGTTKTSGYLTLTNIERIHFNPNVTDFARSGKSAHYYWNDNLNEKHFDINASTACPTSSTTRHEFFPHMCHVETDMSSFTNPSYYSHINGVIMIENGLYAVFEKYENLRITVDTHSHVTCYDGNDGAIGISVAGGTAPYQYSWSNGATTAGISNLTAGDYTVKVSDANGHFTKACRTITAPSTLFAITSVTTTKPNCFGGSDGTISVNSITGGTPSYTYIFYNSLGNVVQSGTDNVLTGSAGNYSVLVFDAVGCQTATSAQISNPAELTASYTNIQDSLCHGGGTGAVTASIDGGTSPYQVTWSNGETGVTGSVAILAGLDTQSVNLFVTDANGCTFTGSHSASVGVTFPQMFANSWVRQPHTPSAFGVPYWRQNMAVSISVTGGAPPYTYNWWMGHDVGGGQRYERMCTQSFDDAILNGEACGGNNQLNKPGNRFWTGSLNNYNTKDFAEGFRLWTHPAYNRVRVEVTDSCGQVETVIGSWSVGGQDYDLYGCTSSASPNFNFFANIDNGTC